MPKWARGIVRLWQHWPVRVALVTAVAVLLLVEVIPLVQPYLIQHTYALGSAKELLQKKDDLFASKLTHDEKQHQFDFNANYNPALQANDAGGGGPQISATAYDDGSKGLAVSDPVNQIDFTIKPKFKLQAGKQDGDKIIYPLLDGTGWLVYTMQAGGVKEDVLLDHANGNNMTLDYDLDLGDNFTARTERDGSIGIYGSDSPVTGKVSTGSEKDAALLQKARQKAPKNKLFFSIPAPVTYEANKSNSAVKAQYELKGNSLKLVATDLKKGRYPLTIDPSVTVTSTADLFRDTNPDSNADFNKTTGSISRGAVTGGVLNSTGGVAWTTNANSMGTARFLSNAAIYDDYAYVAGGAGANSTSNLTSVQYARLSSVNSSIGTWAATTALPTALSRFQLTAYNGYLYAIGGASATTDCATVVNTVYYIRMQTTGELSGSWTATSTLPAGVCGLGVAVYNGKVYAAGGRTGSGAATGVSTVEYATIQPDGSLSTWTADNSTLPAARYDADLWVYNGYIYIVGGNLNGTLTNTVSYAPLASDGSIYGGAGTGSWKATSAFGTARSNMGSTFSSTSDGYMYVQGGCSVYTTQSCTTIRSETQVAQINADGSLGPWSDMATSLATLSRVGNSIIIWRGTMYSFAGCTTMNAGISCATGAPTLATQSYATISAPGQVGPVNTTTALNTAIFAHGAVINNGFLYVIGGCTTATCETATPTTNATRYVAINADGTIGGTWTTSPQTLNGATGLAAFSLVVYNNYLYVTGGYTKASPVSTTWRAQLLASGALSGAWTADAALAANTTYHASVAYRGFLFVFGGCTAAAGSIGCSNYIATVYRFTISPTTGALSARTTTGIAALPVAKAIMAPALYNGYIYLAGGATGAIGQTNLVYYARITDTGTIASWSTATGVLAHTLRRADAYAVNGYLYVVGGHDGGTSTTYGDIEIAKIDMSTGNLPNNFINSVIQVTPRWDTRTVFANGYLYATGGCSNGNPPNACSTVTNVIEYVEVFNASNKGTSTWSSNTAYTGDRLVSASAVYNGYIYVAGGCNSYVVGTTFANTFCNTALNTTVYAPFNPDGTIGGWNAGPNITASDGRVGGCLAAIGGYLYYVGGEDNATGSAVANSYYSQIGAAGLPGAWTQAMNGASATALPTTTAWSGCATFANRLYITGGESAGNAKAATYYTPDLSAGGNFTSWNTGTAFTTARSHLTSVAAGGYLFVLGGDDGAAAMRDVQSIQLNPSTGATTGSWQYSIEMPQAVSFQSIVAANGYLYLFGGRTAATACIAETYVAPINSTGRLGGWSQAVNKFTTARFGAAASFYNGYYYLMGGNDCTAVITGTNVIQYGGEQSQAMKTLISKYADLAGDGTPRKFVTYLTNAVNNGVDIEKWRLNYVSSMEAANSWGAPTIVYPLTNQSTYNVSALDGSSTDKRISRWYYFALDINMEQSFTFTDDVQPTISAYGFYYSAPPGKRLMHGRDFRDQGQQDLDAYPH
jgi:hypothetical protein